jgi:ribosomal-protein-alanine N-acetyltransferase
MPRSLPAITLVPLDAPTLDALSTDPERYAEAHGLSLGGHRELVREVADQTRAFAAGAGALPPWGGFLALDGASRAVVGTCAYKGPPDANGAVEIAYFTFPEQQGRGYATAIADASARVLEKLGFRHLGEITRPEDGPIWRWEWKEEPT